MPDLMIEYSGLNNIKMHTDTIPGILSPDYSQPHIYVYIYIYISCIIRLDRRAKSLPHRRRSGWQSSHALQLRSNPASIIYRRSTNVEQW